MAATTVQSKPVGRRIRLMCCSSPLIVPALGFGITLGAIRDTPHHAHVYRLADNGIRLILCLGGALRCFLYAAMLFINGRNAKTRGASWRCWYYAACNLFIGASAGLMGVIPLANLLR